MEYEFEWDENKNSLNYNKHKVDFNDAVYVFRDPYKLDRLDRRMEYGEERWQTIGWTEFGVLFVVYAERREGKIIRIISARKATKREKQVYMKQRF